MKVATCKSKISSRATGALNPNYLQTVFQIASSPANWPSRFAIVTAYNPNGKPHPLGENQKFDNALETELKLKNIWHWRVNGASPDLSHVELGFAIKVSLEEALIIGSRLKQEAIFWIEENILLIVSCDSDEKQNLGAWTPRLKLCPQP